MANTTYRYGGKNGRPLELEESDDYLVVRTTDRCMLDQKAFSPTAAKALKEFESVSQYDEAGVELLKCRDKANAKQLRDTARSELNKDTQIQFAGRVLRDKQSHKPVIYTENIFVKFTDDTPRDACTRALSQHNLTIKQEPGYARNAFLTAAPEGSGREVFNIANNLLTMDIVEYCHPELIWQSAQRAADPMQWHLHKTEINGQIVDQSANVVAAWAQSQGEGTVIAVIDDGVDVDHEEFTGAGKIVAPRDATLNSNDPRPKFSSDRHGTACAGVACANGNHRASGVAPKAKLMPIRLRSGLGSQAEANAFQWAADNGADVISCSWGPADGQFNDPDDPLHQHVEPLPDSTRLAIDYATNRGRNGKGCVITWAAGNGNESVDNDGYASYPRVIAVAACDDKGKKAPYSDFGNAIWCAFPSNHLFPSVTKGIWTTDRTGGAGYNFGSNQNGDEAGHYTNSFGGTSSACPGAAGVAALILARNPDLSWQDVKDVLKQGTDRIDEAGGEYDANGHSPIYGYGRLNAKKAIDLAQPRQADYTAIHKAIQTVPIQDNQTVSIALAVGDTNPLKTIKVTVDIDHTWIGDLIVSLKAPNATTVPPIVLHNREGRGEQNLKKTYTFASTPGLEALIGKAPQGTWELKVEDTESRDTGNIRSFSLEITF